MKVILVLGCWGNQNNGLCLCSGIENEILDLTLKTERNKEIVDYLDINFKICDRPLYNNIHTAIWNIQEKFSEKGNNVFKEPYFKSLEEFCIFHAKCGLFLRLEIKE